MPRVNDVPRYAELIAEDGELSLPLGSRPDSRTENSTTKWSRLGAKTVPRRIGLV